MKMLSRSRKAGGKGRVAYRAERLVGLIFLGFAGIVLSACAYANTAWSWAIGWTVSVSVIFCATYFFDRETRNRLAAFFAKCFVVGILGFIGYEITVAGCGYIESRKPWSCVGGYFAINLGLFLLWGTGIFAAMPSDNLTNDSPSGDSPFES